GQTNRDFLGVAYDLYDSPASGAKEVRWLGTPKLYPHLPVFLSKAGLQITRPKAYWVPPTKPEVIARLKLPGIEMETLSNSRTLQLAMYRLRNPKPEPGEGSHPFEARHTLKTDGTLERRTETFPAGSVRVPTDQSLGGLAILLLDPRSG